MTLHDGKIMACLDPGRLGPHPATARRGNNKNTIPELTAEQRAALALVSSTAAKHSQRIDSHRGDLLFINNWAHLHARDSYIDGTGPGARRRHLARLWLHNSELGWKVPDGMRVPWDAAFAPRPNALGLPVYSVSPAPVYTAPKYAGGSAAFLIEDPDEDGEDD